MFGWLSTVIYMANIEIHPHPRFTFHLEQQEVALNFARQHGGIAANELPDIVNFITQVPHLSSPKRDTYLKFSISPEKRWLEDYFPIGKVTFQGQAVKLPGVSKRG